MVRKFAVAALPLVLVGCGGGSGGPGGPGGASFESFNSMFAQAPGTTTIKGTGREATYNVDGATVDVSDYSATRDVTLDVELDAEEEITSVEMDTGTTRRTWNNLNSRSSELQGVIAAVSNNGQDFIAVAGPEANDFQYQTFGAWLTGYNTGSGRAGIFSVGAETAAANVPTGGAEATFTGVAAGLYMDNSRTEPSLAAAQATLMANFAAGEVGFQTTGTQLENGMSRPDLNMTGSMSYEPGQNALSGDVVTASGMSGDIDGRFYGADAEEIGGIFALKGQNGESFGGGFGASRP